jgi:alkaline phosphatase D
MVPMVGLWDDHDTTNDSWEAGAANHQPKTEGDWNIRRAASMQAYREWLPVSEEPWKAYHIGSLATLYRTESRLLGRTRPAGVELAKAHRAENPGVALRDFRDGAWRDPTATMLGSTQESWLAHELKQNSRTSIWQLVGMATIMGRTLMPEKMPGWVRPEANERVVNKYKRDVLGSQLGLPMWMDRWDGYPAARSRLLRAAQRANADLVMLSGDSHNAWAYSLADDGQPAGVEFAGQSVTSNGMEAELRADPKEVARAFVATNPELVWADTSQRGYVMIDITPQRVSGEWLFLRTTTSRSTVLAGTHRLAADRGRRKFSVS